MRTASQGIETTAANLIAYLVLVPAAALLVFATLAPMRAHAQDDATARADKLVDEAAELGSQGKYEAAIEKFKATGSW